MGLIYSLPRKSIPPAIAQLKTFCEEVEALVVRYYHLNAAELSKPDVQKDIKKTFRRFGRTFWPDDGAKGKYRFQYLADARKTTLQG